METQTYIGTLTIITCCHEGCGVPFGITSQFEDRRRQDHNLFYCPNGHSQLFSGKNREDLLKQELARKNEAIEYLQQANNSLHNQVTVLNYSVRAQKAAKTKIMNRVKNGVCPCCTRKFVDLQRHFQNKHPELVQQTKENPLHAKINSK